MEKWSPPAIHVIADNLSAHKTKLVDAFLTTHAHVRLHFTATYSSWLNQVENGFAKVQRHVIARGVFRLLRDLRSKLLRYIRHYKQKNSDSHQVDLIQFKTTDQTVATSSIPCTRIAA